MNKYSGHGYSISQLLDCGVGKSLMSKQNSIDLMSQHRLEGICNVNYTMSLNSGISSELLSANLLIEGQFATITTITTTSKGVHSRAYSKESSYSR